MSSFSIQLGDGEEIVFDDIIGLEQHQIDRILAAAATKTKRQWERARKGIKIRLTPKQIERVKAFKTRVVQGHTTDSLMDESVIVFTDHGSSRVAERIDNLRPDEPAEPESLEGMVEIIRTSTNLLDQAEWKGYHRLSYTFKGEYDRRECLVSVVFEAPVLIITVVAPATGHNIRDINPRIAEQLAKLKLLDSE